MVEEKSLNQQLADERKDIDNWTAALVNRINQSLGKKGRVISRSTKTNLIIAREDDDYLLFSTSKFTVRNDIDFNGRGISLLKYANEIIKYY